MTSLLRSGVHFFRRWKLARLGPAPEWKGIGDGLRMLIDPADWMDREFYLGTYDPWLLYVIRRIVRPGDVCVDIGAHKGYVAMRLARATGSSGRVFAFEPDPRARLLLEQNCRRNALSHVSIFPFALGARSGSMSFALSRQLGWSSLFPNDEAAAAVAERAHVEVRSLDGMVGAGDVSIDPARLAFVKIDVEGAEPLVLDGMRNLLAKGSPVMWIEVNRDSLQASGGTPRDLQALVEDTGYRLFQPHRTRRLGLPRVTVQPLERIELRHEPIFDVLVAREAPARLLAA
jgi:FkbM family methyltransferase